MGRRLFVFSGVGAGIAAIAVCATLAHAARPFDIRGFIIGMDFNDSRIRNCPGRELWGAMTMCKFDDGASIQLTTSGKSLNVLAAIKYIVRYPGGLGADSEFLKQMIAKYGDPTKHEEVPNIGGEIMWGSTDSDFLIAIWQGDGIEINVGSKALFAQDAAAALDNARKTAPPPKL